MTAAFWFAAGVVFVFFLGSILLIHERVSDIRKGRKLYTNFVIIHPEAVQHLAPVMLEIEAEGAALFDIICAPGSYLMLIAGGKFGRYTIREVMKGESNGVR